MTTRSVTAVLTAAVIGASARWSLGIIAGESCGLLAANICGCILIGWASSPRQEKWDSIWFTVGLCGSLTSFAALAVSLGAALEDQRWSFAVLMGLATIAGCGVGFDLGRSLGDRK
tara:strand:- start:4596 stop:4943 length:348 start_codon:yes stop_codon:yes gene_type:complete